MKINIPCTDYRQLAEDLRSLIATCENADWSLVDCISEKGTKFKRVVYTPKGIEDYSSVQLVFFSPTKDDADAGMIYLTVRPVKADNYIAEDFDRCVRKVFSKWCDFMNAQTQLIDEYTIYLKA